MPRKKRYKELTAETLQIEQTKDHVKNRGLVFGSRYGKPIEKFVTELFRINEILPRVKKMTDSEIQRQIGNEYSQHKATLHYWVKHPKSITQARSDYNGGKRTHEPPEKISWRYNHIGEAIYRGRPVHAEAIRKVQARMTVLWWESPGIMIPGTPHREWMLPFDAPDVIAAYHKLLKRREATRKHHAQKHMEAS